MLPCVGVPNFLRNAGLMYEEYLRSIYIDIEDIMQISVLRNIHYPDQGYIELYIPDPDLLTSDGSILAIYLSRIDDIMFNGKLVENHYGS